MVFAAGYRFKTGNFRAYKIRTIFLDLFHPNHLWFS
jgi:hypothetical protein